MELIDGVENKYKINKPNLTQIHNMYNFVNSTN